MILISLFCPRCGAVLFACSSRWCHKQYSADVPMTLRTWEHRRSLIKERLLTSDADVVCIQEADGSTFDADFDFMDSLGGYDRVLHRKFRFRCATFYKRDKFALEREAHKDRALVTTLRWLGSGSDAGSDACDSRVLHVVNCHLSGGAAPERRLRQVHDGLDQVRKWTSALEQDLAKKSGGKRPSPKAVAEAERALAGYRDGGVVVCGDFNSDGNTAVRRLLVEGSVTSDWREPQYPTLRLTSSEKSQSFGRFVDAAELAWGGNVCDGDYSNFHSDTGCVRPATYVVPNLASMLLLPIGEEEGPPRTQFGMQIAKGLADTLNLKDFCESELNTAFDLVDHDGNGVIDSAEVQALLEGVYVATYGQQIEQERNNFFRGFGTKNRVGDGDGLTRGEFVARLRALQQDAEGERKAFGLAKGLNLQDLSEAEMERAFDEIDLDGNGLLDEDEFQTLLQNVYVKIYGEDIEKHRTEFFAGFRMTGGDTNGDSVGDSDELTREQFTQRLLALHQELEGGRTGSELAEVRTEADVQKMKERFTPLLQKGVDAVFDNFSSNGETLTQDEVNDFLIKTNGELGRGGTYRHTTAMFQSKEELTRSDWHSVFARELAEGKWWQVVYDLEMCGFNVRSYHSKDVDASGGGGGRAKHQFYQGWLDYVYFQNIQCTGVQDVLTDEERSRVYNDGDALPNEWHPSGELDCSDLTFSPLLLRSY